MFRCLLCSWLPWHRWVIRKQYSRNAECLTCSCGRKYAIHHGMQVMVPWDQEIDDMYDLIDRDLQ